MKEIGQYVIIDVCWVRYHVLGLFSLIIRTTIQVPSPKRDRDRDVIAVSVGQRTVIVQSREACRSDVGYDTSEGFFFCTTKTCYLHQLHLIWGE